MSWVIFICYSHCYLFQKWAHLAEQILLKIAFIIIVQKVSSLYGKIAHTLRQGLSMFKNAKVQTQSLLTSGQSYKHIYNSKLRL